MENRDITDMGLEELTDLGTRMGVGDGAQSDIYLIKTDSQNYVLKKPHANATYRHFCNITRGKTSNIGEYGALEMLSDKDIGPKPVKEFENNAFLMTCVPENANLRNVLREMRDKNEFNFDYLPIVKKIKQIHDSGIYHGDMRAKNVLLNGSPHIIDFESSDSFDKNPKTKNKEIKNDLITFAKNVSYNEDSQEAILSAIQEVYGKKMKKVVEKKLNGFVYSTIKQTGLGIGPLEKGVICDVYRKIVPFFDKILR